MIVIVGGGITGLSLSHYLAREGLDDHVVLEAASEPGGVIRSVEVEGRVVEMGPQRLRMTPLLVELVDALGLAGELVEAPEGLPLWVYSRGALRKVPLTLESALTSDLLSWPGRLRVLLEPFTAGPRDDETVAEFFSRKLGREAYERLLGPFFGGLYAGDPASMYVRHALAPTLRLFGVGRSLVGAVLRRRLRRGDAIPATSFRDGLQTLPGALARERGDRVRLGTEVRAIRRDGGRWAVGTDDDVIPADDVVLTVPADVAARLLEGAAPEAAGIAARLRYNPLAVVHLHSRCDLRGLGYQVAYDEAMATRGVTFNDALFDRDGVYTAYLGGGDDPERVSEPDEVVGRTAAREFEEATGCAADVLRVGRTRLPAWDRSWAALDDGIELPDGIHLAANWESRLGIPGRLRQARALASSLAGADRTGSGGG